MKRTKARLIVARNDRLIVVRIEFPDHVSEAEVTPEQAETLISALRAAADDAREEQRRCLS